MDLSVFSRLAPLLDKREGRVLYRLEFGKDGEKRALVRVSVEAELALTCQRCLERVTHQVNASSRLALVRGPQEAARLPEMLEPLMAGEGCLMEARDLVEDELLLGLPVSPRHEEMNCGHALAVEPEETGAEELPDNPFAVLAALRVGRKPH